MNHSPALEPFSRLLALGPVDRTRRNHGLEHATLTLLAHKIHGLSLVGRSTPNGFYLYGTVSTEAVTEAVHEALQRMRNGETNLAVHPNCGTNFVTAGTATGVAAYLGFLGANTWRSRWSRIPIVALFCTVALIFAQPLGLMLQQHVTTSGEVRDMEIVRIERRGRGNLVTHFVTTRG
jgi:hypothetical protein